MAEPIHHRPQQPLTPLLTARLPLLLDFHAACRALCSAVLEHLATALGIPADWFASRHDPDGGPSGSVLRMLYYPGARGTPAGGDTDDDDEARGDIRAGAHSDFGSITCLFQLPGQPGLEILTPEGEWAAVAVDPDPLAPSASSESPSSDLSAAAAPSPSSTTATTAAATAPRGRRNLPILVNIGDLLEEWTGGLLKSTRHRVVFPQVPSPPPSSNPGEASGSSSDRYSLAYFCHPLDDAALEPVPSRLVQEHIASSSSSRTEAAAAAETATTTTAERAVITAKDHLARRLAETYTIPTASP
jgi:isopenicillin N synthase-like dioxygenase